MIALPLNRRKTWRHKSVLALIREAGGGDPVAIIRRKTKELVRWAKANFWAGPPFKPLELASLRGIHIRESENLFSAEAQLTPVEGNQLLLEFNPRRPSGRTNYSIDHEIVHTLFDDCYETVHQRRTRPIKSDPIEELELLCQVGAAELLMPEEEFCEDLARRPFSLRSTLELSARYVASREATARRMITFSTQPAALVFLSRRLKPTEMRLQQENDGAPFLAKMRVLYTARTPDFPLYLPRDKSAPEDSCVYRVSDPDEIADGRENWGLPGFDHWHVEAMALPQSSEIDDGSPSVMALVLPCA